MSRTSNVLMFAIVAMFLSACQGMTAVETTGAVVTGAGALVAWVEAMRPMLPPEEAARLTAIAGDVQTVVEATKVAVGTMAQAIADVRAEQVAIESSEWSVGEKASLGTGLAASAVAVSRVLSRLKHGKKKEAI